MTIAFFDVFTPSHEAFLRSHLSEHTLLFDSRTLSLETVSVAASADIVSVREYSKLTGDVLAQLPAAKMVALRITGFDNVDHAYASERGLVVSNVPAYGEVTVAEYAFAHILNLSRKMHATLATVGVSPVKREDITGWDLSGKTLGIVGTGKIGSKVARIGHGFGMQLLGFDPFHNETLVDAYGLRYASLTELLQQSDVISVHTPLSEQTRGLLNSENMAQIKQGAILVNTSRGPVVETEALLSAMRTGRLSAAAVDVFEGEEAVGAALETGAEVTGEAFSAFRQLQEVGIVVTPHNAFNSKEASERILQTTVENIHAFLAGTPQNVVGHARDWSAVPK